MTRAWAIELAPFGIRVVSIHVAYLAGDKARFATGTQFTLDAGLLTR